MILALDLGTTNWKAAIYNREGQLMGISSLPAPTTEDEGCPCYDPAQIPHFLLQLIQSLPKHILPQVQAIALSGMAEAGVLMDMEQTVPVSMVWPWFDRRALQTYQQFKDEPLYGNRSAITGLPNSYKYGIYKLLTMLRKYQAHKPLFLGLVEYAAFLLTGNTATDETLAARSYAYDIVNRRFDSDFLNDLGLSADIFPPVVTSGASIGTLLNNWSLPRGIPVCIAGHDHVCAAHAAGILETGGVFVSMGTAMVMLCGVDVLAPKALKSGLSFGPSPAGARYTCLGSIQSAGGSINFWKGLLYGGADYSALLKEAQTTGLPSGMVYLPYLAGSGAPHMNANAHGALLGITASTKREEIITATYEGISFESRYVLSHMGVFPRLICMGGLTRHQRLMEILSHVTGLPAAVPSHDEGTLYGAARLVAGKLAHPFLLPPLRIEKEYMPSPTLFKQYSNIYHQSYLPCLDLSKNDTQEAVES